MPERGAGHKIEDSAQEAPKRKRTATKDRFSHHTCWHHDAWQGILMMPPAEVGVYWRIILLMYIRRAALADDDRELARLCHTELKTYRRIKSSLIARGRIVVDDDNGIIFDERTVRELVDAGFFSQAQTERAISGHKKRSGKRVDRASAVNRGVAANNHEVGVNSASNSRATLVENDTVSLSKPELRDENGSANQYPLPNESTSTVESGSNGAPTEQARSPATLTGGERAPGCAAKLFRAPSESEEAFAARCSAAASATVAPQAQAARFRQRRVRA